MNCSQALLARYADDPGSLESADRAALEAHLGSCAACRAALDDQRYVAVVLRDRLAAEPRPGLVSRVSARIERETDVGFLGLVNWRAWTVGLAPIAAALVAAAYLTAAPASSTSTSDVTSLTEWTASAWSTSALVDSAPTDDALIEAVLTGAAPSASGGSDDR